MQNMQFTHFKWLNKGRIIWKNYLPLITWNKHHWLYHCKRWFYKFNLAVKQPTIFFLPLTNSLLDKHPSDNPIRAETMPQTKMFNLPKQFLWQRNSNETFLNTLKLDKYQSRLSTFEETQFDPTCEGVDIAT